MPRSLPRSEQRSGTGNGTGTAPALHRLVIEYRGGEEPRVRLLLKRMLRQLGLRCVSLDGEHGP